MKTRLHTARRTVVRSALAGLALVIAIPTIAMAAHPFTDVPAGQWFSDSVDWAYNNNITTGVSPTEFGGDQGFTRYQAVTMLERMDTNIIQPGLDTLADDVSALDDMLNSVEADMSTMFHAVVHGDTGTRESNSSTAGVTSTRLSTGVYELGFPVEISACAWQGTLTVAHDGGVLVGQPSPVSGSIGLSPDFDAALDPSGIYVKTWDAAGASADRDFTVSVTCSPLGGYVGPWVLSPVLLP